MEKKQIIQKAKEFCKKHNITTYPVEIIKLCESYGIKVLELYLPNDVSGLIIVQNEPIKNFDTDKLIAVTSRDSARRKRFTIAHELAHFILHREDGKVFAHRDIGQTGGIETEANVFASNILMPENLVKDALSYIKDTAPVFAKVEYIANQFAVSAQAAQVRLEQMGVL